MNRQQTTAKNSQRQRTFAVSCCLLLLLAAFRPAAFHVHLTRSDPQADSTVASGPGSVRLWFSEPVQVAVTRVVVTSGRDTLQLARPRMGDNASSVVTRVDSTRMQPGPVKVDWTTMSRDGHVVRGTFTFRIAAPVTSRR